MTSTVNAAVKKQLEFYFSDSNFRKDTFLRAAAESDPDGFVPIATLLTFNKLKSLTTDPAVVAESLVGSEIAAVSEDGLKIRRVSELPVTDSSKECTLYVKGYPVDDAEVTHDSVSAMFSTYGKVNLVRLRRDPTTKIFKGSCFIEFAEPASVAAAIAASHDSENKVVLEYKGTPFLCVMTIASWLERKADKRNKKAVKSEAAPETGVKRKREAGDVDVKQEEGPVQFTPGLILKVENVPTDATLYQIKDAFKVFGDLKYVEYENGSSIAFVRMGNNDAANTVLNKISEGMTLIPEQPNLTAALITGEEEVAYWTKIGTDAGRKSNQGGRGGGRGRGGRGGRGRGGRGGRGGGRKRSRND